MFLAGRPHGARIFRAVHPDFAGPVCDSNIGVDHQPAHCRDENSRPQTGSPCQNGDIGPEWIPAVERPRNSLGMALVNAGVAKLSSGRCGIAEFRNPVRCLATVPSLRILEDRLPNWIVRFTDVI